MEGLARARRDGRDAETAAGASGRRAGWLVAAADETAVDETEAGEAGGRRGRGGDATARRARGSVAEGRARARTNDGGEGADDAVAECLTAGDADGVRATCGEARDDGREAATSDERR